MSGAEASESTPLLRDSSPLNVDGNGAVVANHTKKVRGYDSRNALASKEDQTALPLREKVYLVLEGLYKPHSIGRIYESLIVSLILASILAFVLASLFVEKYNANAWYFGWCDKTCDMIWFGNYADNGLGWLGRGDTFNTSLLEVTTIFIFTVDYCLRLWTADIESPAYAGFWGRLRYIPSFYSVVDLISTVPFFFDALNPEVDVAATQFLRMFRFFRMLRIEGRYNLALDLFSDVFSEQKHVLGTALFIGTTTWITVASLFYVAERRNTDMIYCPNPHEYCVDGIQEPDDVDTDLCDIDSWGFVNCTLAGCPPYGIDGTHPSAEPCYNLYRSIPESSYYSLLNLFGEFPLIDQHSVAGKFVGVFTAVIAVAVFALPTGLIGNGIEDLLGRRREAERVKAQVEDEATGAGSEAEAVADEDEDASDYADNSTLRGRMHNFLHYRVGSFAAEFDWIINGLTIGLCASFIVGTFAVKVSDEGSGAAWSQSQAYDPNAGLSDEVTFDANSGVVGGTSRPISGSFGYYSNTDGSGAASAGSMLAVALNNFDFLVVFIFSVEYIFRWFASTSKMSFLTYLTTYNGIVDLFPILPYWIWVFASSQLIPGSDYASYHAIPITFVRALRMFRLLKHCTNAFSTFDDVVRSSSDVLLITGFTALIVWVFFSAALYLTERDNPDESHAHFYKTVPHAMWVTLLNLSGESPLDKYSVWGQVLTGIIGIFATGLFGIPIGILGAGFEELMEEQTDEVNGEGEVNAAAEEFADEEAGDTAQPFLLGTSKPTPPSDSTGATSCETALYNFTEGEGSTLASWFEILIYLLIIITVAIGIVQTIEGHEDDFAMMEWIAVVAFTAEYALRFIGAGADPAFAHIQNPILRRLRFIASFYSLVDLAAIVPFYLALAMPGSWVDRHDEYLRMLRLLRLLKLDKYVPSISLIDDVFRLKRDMLVVTGYAAASLWFLFTAVLYVSEYRDESNSIDAVPVYGCDDDCTMMDRFRTYMDSLVYTVIHLTGDYPIITYNAWSRVICFFMVIAAVGVVSIPSGLVANGFAQIVQTTSRKKHGEQIPTGGNAGDDWYEIRLRELENEPAPASRFGSTVDRWQVEVNEFLNGEVDPRTGKESHTCQSISFRVFMMTLIIANVIAVLLETIPDIDRAIGNQKGNLFDAFESISIFFFSLEYALRLFSARKNLEALYSPYVYATTFYGIVDFLSTAPWYIERLCLVAGMKESADMSTVFRIFRIFRLLQLEDFLIGFRKLDNVFRASKDVLKATALMAIIIWVGCGALFFIFEQGNPNWRNCDDSIPLRGETDSESGAWIPGCYDFASTQLCNEHYGPNMCEQTSFVNMPDSLFYTAVFLGGEWGLVDFTWGGRFVCMFLCVIGIALYAIPVGSLFDSFGAVIGLAEDEDEDNNEEEE